MSESVQRDDHRSSFHDMVHFRYDEHRPALHAEGLTLPNRLFFCAVLFVAKHWTIHGG
jgi:hypothetical protein